MNALEDTLIEKLKTSKSDYQYRLIQNEVHNDDESINLIDKFCELFDQNNCKQQHEEQVIRLLIIICVVSQIRDCYS